MIAVRCVRFTKPVALPTKPAKTTIDLVAAHADRVDFELSYDPRLRILFVDMPRLDRGQRSFGFPTEQVEYMEFDAESLAAGREAMAPMKTALKQAREHTAKAG